jgi:hypothetical protein
VRAVILGPAAVSLILALAVQLSWWFFAAWVIVLPFLCVWSMVVATPSRPPVAARPSLAAEAAACSAAFLVLVAGILGIALVKLADEYGWIAGLAFPAPFHMPQ